MELEGTIKVETRWVEVLRKSEVYVGDNGPCEDRPDCTIVHVKLDKSIADIFGEEFHMCELCGRAGYEEDGLPENWIHYGEERIVLCDECEVETRYTEGPNETT